MAAEYATHLYSMSSSVRQDPDQPEDVHVHSEAANLDDSLKSPSTPPSENPSSGFVFKSNLPENNKQIYLPRACLPYENNLVYCFILSVWDNIIGPQTVQVWKRKRCTLPIMLNSKHKEHDDCNMPQCNKSVVKSDSKDCSNISNEETAGGTSLTQEAISNTSSKATKPTSKFVALEDDMPVPHCLSMVVSIAEQEKLLELAALTAAHLTRAVQQLKTFLRQPDSLPRVALFLEEPLQELCEVLVSLRRCSLARFPPSMPAAQPPSDKQFTLRLLTSHLNTLGCTVVVGESSSLVNKIVLWLALFLQPKELPLCRLCVGPEENKMHLGLLLQDRGGPPRISGEALLQCGRPVTVCDLITGTVRQTVVRSSATNSPREMMRDVTEVSGLVRQFLLDLELLATHSTDVRMRFITAFTRSLRYHALAVLSWVQHARPEKKQVVQQHLREAMSLDQPSLDIVTNIAEQLLPGGTGLAAY